MSDNPMQGDPVVGRLSTLLASEGQAVLADATHLERLLNQTCAAYPGKVKALVLLLEKKAVAYLSNWANDKRPERLSFQQVRDGLAKKFADANLLDAQAAHWAVEAWAAALGLRPKPASPAAALPAAAAAAVGAASAAAPGPHNAYAPPTATVDDPQEHVSELGTLLPDGRGVGVGRSLGWIAGGWRLFKESPGIWIANVVIFLGLSIVSNLVPIVGSIAMFLASPILVAGLMLGCRAQESGEALQVGHLFEGFKTYPGRLILVGLVYLLVIMGVFMIGGAVFGFGVAGMMSAAGRGAVMTGTLVVAVVVVMLLMMPVMMAYYYAATLVALNEFGVMEAIKSGFRGGFKNILPLLVYGIATMVLMVLSAIPILLGLLVMMPVAVASMYSSYRDIFYEE